MKKQLIALSLAALFAGSSMAATLQQPTGTVTVTGKITARSCTIVEGKEDQAINLGEISAKELETSIQNGTVQAQSIGIQLENCGVDATDSVRIDLDVPQIRTHQGKILNMLPENTGTNAVLLLRSEGTGNQKGAEITLSDAGKYSFPLQQLTHQNGGGDDTGYWFRFSVEFAKKDNDPIKAGEFRTQIPFTIAYK